ncbi:hypothetical protein RHMOL_Rhmol06G0019500 [Rhododendron molle]|uniref:Uncharacterized protein n=1 Tax=Rhododendron molle TaxID=49168 RepID=A0ACC0N9V9_RHOML|nr:hypothetical protein RHMOL_Rhmol06G0019500 [Rhododendron molle]
MIAGEDLFDDPVAASHLPRLLSNHPFSAPNSDLTYRSRFFLHDPSDAMGLSGLLVLPQPESKLEREPEPEPKPRKLRQNGVSDELPIDSKLLLPVHDS